MKPVKPVGALLFPAVCTVGFCLGLEAGSFQYVLLKIAAEFSLDKTMMGSLVSVQFFGMMICPLLAGRISDRVSKKRIAAIFLLVFSAGCLLCGKSPGTGAFMAGIFVVGGAFTTAQNATIAALTDVYGTRSGKYVNICQCLYSFGAVSGPILASGLIEGLGYSWRTVFLLCSVVFSLLFFLILITKFEVNITIPDKNGRSDDECPTGAAAAEVQGVRSIFNRTLAVLLVTMLIYMAVENGFTYFLDTFFTTGLQAPHASAFAISSFWIGTALARAIGSFFYRHQKKLVTACLGISIPILFVLPFLESALACTLLCFLLGFIFGPVWPYLMSQAGGEFPGFTGTVTSLMAAAGGIGGTLIPLLAGAFADAFGIQASYLLLGGLSLLGAALYCQYSGVIRKGKRSNS